MTVTPRFSARGGALFTLAALAALPLACTKAIQPGDPLPGLPREQREAFEEGRIVFERVFVQETGLGPLFNADACASATSSR